MNSMLLIAVLCVAVVTDTRSNRIPNWLTGPALLTGLILSLLSPFESLGITDALLGMVVGLLILLPGYAMGKMGAGDVKLMAVCGCYLGSDAVINAGLLTLLSGGVLALVWLAMHKFHGVELVAAKAQSLNEVSMPAQSMWSQRIPYALAIACGNSLVIFTGFSIFSP